MLEKSKIWIRDNAGTEAHIIAAQVASGSLQEGGKKVEALLRITIK